MEPLGLGPVVFVRYCSIHNYSVMLGIIWTNLSVCSIELCMYKGKG